MPDFNWKHIDLNLLVAFNALYETGSVSGAAEKVFISQSAMSHSLSRLRGLLKDRLFERRDHRMQPTEKARQIAPVVQQTLLHLQQSVFACDPFVPAKYQGVCRIGLTDYAEMLFAPALYDEISVSAPKAKISFIHVNRHNYQSLLNEEPLDVIIGSFPALDSQLVAEKIYTEHHVCLFDSKEVDIQLPLDLAQFVRYPQALVSPDGQLQTQVDSALAEQGIHRQVRVASRNFLTIRNLVTGRKLLCIVPQLMTRLDCNTLSTAEPPIAVPDFDISLVYRKSQIADEKNRWLRELTSKLISQTIKQALRT